MRKWWRGRQNSKPTEPGRVEEPPLEGPGNSQPFHGSCRRTRKGNLTSFRPADGDNLPLDKNRRGLNRLRFRPLRFFAAAAVLSLHSIFQKPRPRRRTGAFQTGTQRSGGMFGLSAAFRWCLRTRWPNTCPWHKSQYTGRPQICHLASAFPGGISPRPHPPVFSVRSEGNGPLDVRSPKRRRVHSLFSCRCGLSTPAMPRWRRR